MILFIIIPIYINTLEMCILTVNNMTMPQKLHSNPETPDFKQACGKRFGYYYEPVEEEKLNVGLLKCLTWSNRLIPRKLYLNPYFDEKRNKRIENKEEKIKDYIFLTKLTCKSLKIILKND
jgi:hypothetical protein